MRLLLSRTDPGMTMLIPGGRPLVSTKSAEWPMYFSLWPCSSQIPPRSVSGLVSGSGGYPGLAQGLDARLGASYAVEFWLNSSRLAKSTEPWPVDPAAARGRLWKQEAAPTAAHRPLGNLR